MNLVPQQLTKKAMKNETVTISTKQTYETPELSIFGHIENLTQGGGTPNQADGTAST